MGSKYKQEHEAFKNRLVAEVLESESDVLPMDKVVMIIWQFRDDPAVVSFMARFVAKFSGSRTVFNGIEFYLPQLAHMIIHLEAKWKDAILERFALVIAQQSLHFALQFNWILQGALEDYQPELPSGLPNPSYKPLFYSRCIKLLTNLERCVVYGRPRSRQLQRMYEQGKISKEELQIMESADRRFHALQLTETDSNRQSSMGKEGLETSSTFSGVLLFKRPVRLGTFRTKGWKKRYFVIEEQMFNCYRTEADAQQHKNLVRAMPLDGATIVDEELKGKDKYPHMFRVVNRTYEFMLRASSAEDKNVWIRRLKEENDCSSLFQSQNGPWQQLNHMKQTSMRQLSSDLEKANEKVVGDLSPAQFARYEFFRNERNFVRRLTDIAEELRHEEPADRKKLAPPIMEKIKIAPTVYLPLCNSSDTWQRVCKPIPNSTKVFSTKERCPTIMYFLSAKSDKTQGRPLDVCEFLTKNFDVSPDNPSKTAANGSLADVERIKKDIGASKRSLENFMSSSEFSEKGKQDLEGEIIELERRLELALKENSEQGFEVQAQDDEYYDAKENENDHSLANLVKVDIKEAASTKGSLVWSDEEGMDATDTSSKLRGKTIPRMIKESVINIPRKLAARVEVHRKKSQKSPMDNAVELTTVPILEGKRSVAEDDGEGSVMMNDTIVMGDQTGSIEAECINRAKAIVTGGESWAERSARMLREEAAKGATLKEGTVEISSLMSKSNDDLRQEVFVMQMIHFFESVFASAKLPIWLKTYRILSTSKTAGVLEVLTDATSLDGLKKAEGYPEEGGLRRYFENVYGPPESKSFKAAQDNFMRSLAGYALVSYFLGVKDRHNGNIMIDLWGRLIFIDFGFVMGLKPGHEFSFERAPFKLTKEYVEVMGGRKSACYKEFKRLFVAGFMEIRKHSQIAVGLVEIMMFKSNFPCFTGWRYGNGIALRNFSKRLMLKVPDNQVEKKASALVDLAEEHFGTYLYDVFQKATCGYAM